MGLERLSSRLMEGRLGSRDQGNGRGGLSRECGCLIAGRRRESEHGQRLAGEGER